MPNQTDIDDPAWQVECFDCGKTFRRRALVGAKPKRCDDCREIKKRQDIDKLRAKQLQKPHYLEPQSEVGGSTGYPDLGQAEEDLPVVAKVEPSWLDDAEPQEQLVERKRRELGLDEEEFVDEAVEQAQQDVAAPGDNPLTRPGPVDYDPFPTPTEDEIRELEEAVAKASGKAKLSVISEADSAPEGTSGRAEVCIAPGCQNPDPVHVSRFCAPHWQQISLEDRGVLLGAKEGSAPFNKAVVRALRHLRG